MSVTKLLQCLRDELVRRDYAATTIRSYIQIVEAFRQHAGARLDRLTPAQLRRYHLFLLEERRLAVGTVVTQICALRFFCRYVLKRRDVREDLPYPKERHRCRRPEPRRSPAVDCRGEDLYHRRAEISYGPRRVPGVRATRLTRIIGADNAGSDQVTINAKDGVRERSALGDEAAAIQENRAAAHAVSTIGDGNRDYLRVVRVAYFCSRSATSRVKAGS